MSTPATHGPNGARPLDVLLCDVTLREGEQTPGVVLTREDRQAILALLAESGVPQAQVGVLARPDTDTADLAELCASAEGIDTEIMTMGQHEQWREMVDTAIGCGADVIHSSFFVSRYVNSDWGDEERDRLAARVGPIVERIKDSGCQANISLIDASRAESRDLRLLTEAAAKAGADRIRIPDTAGALTPDQTDAMVTLALEACGDASPRIGVHCHNDFGLALANTLAGIRAGARMADVSINGLGDRCGNAVLGEVAATLQLLMGSDAGIDLTSMTALSRRLAQMSAIPLPGKAPLVGEFAFMHEIDVHVGELIHHPEAFQLIPAERVGNRTQVIFGTKSGPSSLEYMEAVQGLRVPPQLHEALLEALTDADRAAPGKVIDEEAFRRILDRLISESEPLTA